jgi:CheY-like chemotaxis protein
VATILIVDDEKPVRDFLAAALQQEGHDVLEAWHGRHALSVIAGRQPQPDLVLSDVMMPLMSGVELCKTLRADPATAEIRIVLMSAAHVAAGRSAGADAVIGKPFDLDALENLVRKLLAA